MKQGQKNSLPRFFLLQISLWAKFTVEIYRLQLKHTLNVKIDYRNINYSFFLDAKNAAKGELTVIDKEIKAQMYFPSLGLPEQSINLENMPYVSYWLKTRYKRSLNRRMARIKVWLNCQFKMYSHKRCGECKGNS